MSRVLFISEKFIKDNTSLDENIDMKKIRPTIWQSQIQYIQNLLGTLLYEDLLAKIQAGTLAGDDLTLVDDYIADCLTYWCLYELQIPLLFNFRNKSTATNNSDYSQPISTKEMERIENRFKHKAEFFSKRITLYLEANPNLYPLYMKSNDIDELLPESGKSTVSVYLEGMMPQCRKYLYTTDGEV
jgi:hypothetical protein